MVLDGCPMFAPAYMGRRRRAQPLRTLLLRGQEAAGARALMHGVKALEKHPFRPMYAGANMGHPSREVGFVTTRESSQPRCRDSNSVVFRSRTHHTEVKQ